MSRKATVLGVVVLLGVQVIWHAWLLPPTRFSAIASALLFSLPLLPSIMGFLLGRRDARFWAGVASLFYFCHGVTEAWTIAPARSLALLEAGLAVVVIVASCWEGLRARMGKKKPPPTTV